MNGVVQKRQREVNGVNSMNVRKLRHLRRNEMSHIDEKDFGSISKMTTEEVLTELTKEAQKLGLYEELPILPPVIENGGIGDCVNRD